MLKPYYDEGGITIYHGDCREVLAGIAPCGLVATDPPYNAGKDYGTYKDNLSEQDYAGFMAEVADACLALAPKQFWIAPRYRIPLWLELLPSAHLVVIRRGAAGPYRGGWSDQFEIALAIGKPNRPDSDLWDNIRLKGEGYFSGPLGRLARELRGDDGLLQPGKSARGAGYTVELLERNEHGISALRFTFDEPPGRDGVHLFWGSRTRWAFEIQP